MTQITGRMNSRIEALASIADVLLPAFCEGQPCDQSCPYYSQDVTNTCEWLKTYRAIVSLAEKANTSKEIS
jgi:predicted metal-binding protein